MRALLVPALLAIVAIGCGDRIAQPEIHLIPRGYTGHVLILRRVVGGEPLIREGWSRVYRIPPAGVLISSTDDNQGWGRPRFFYLAPDGSRAQLAHDWLRFMDGTPETSRELGVHGLATGTLVSSDPSCEVHFESYFVGTKRQALARKDDGEGILDSYLAAHPACPPGAALFPTPGRPGAPTRFSITVDGE